MAEPSGSSPPARINYRFRESSYYTDDQSDSCYGGDGGGADVADSIKADSDDESESDEDHEQHCRHHINTLATHCNARTQAGKKCSRKAKVFHPDHLPVCSLHDRYYLVEKSGRCQAIEKCGRLCNRFAPHAPPYHLCAVHEQGTDTLPCGILSLPTEIHLMIFRYLFPDDVPTHGLERHAGAILRVNRALNLAASSIVYNELEFKASIDRSRICVLGRSWDTEGVNTKHGANINKVLCQAGAQRIRKLHIEVKFANSQIRIKGIGTNELSVADYDLYQVRDTVRKLVDLLQPLTGSSALKKLEIRPAPGLNYHWSVDEVVAALFFMLEPFIALGPVEAPVLHPCSKPTFWYNRFQTHSDTITNAHKDDTYRRLRKIWLRNMKGKSTSYTKHREGVDQILITHEYHKIEELWLLIQKHELATSTKHGWMSNAFQGIERVIHIARTVDMNTEKECKDGLERMRQIREAITLRWVNAHRQEQRSASAIADCISSMLHVDDPKDLYPDVFEVETLDPVLQDTSVNYNWPELGKVDAAPRLGEAGVTYTEEDFRIRIHKDGKAYVRLKTPAIVRQLRFLKRT